MAELTKVIALDCKMIGVAPWVWVFLDSDSSTDEIPKEEEYDEVARVSLVNEHLACIMDTFVKPRGIVLDYRTPVSGVRQEDLVNGENFKEVQRKVKEILEGRTLVGHRVRHSLEMLDLTHPKCDIRDISEYKPFKRMNNNRKPALRSVAERLGVTVPAGEPSAVEDARVVMRVYQKVAAEWEKRLAK